MSRILVVEDEERIAGFVQRGLRAAGHTVEAVGTAREALQALRGRTPELIVLDLGLPDSDGVDLLAAARGEGHRVPVIVLTARDDVDQKVAAFEAGADDYLTKPFAFEELLARVRARLRQRGDTEVQELVHGDVRLDLRTRRVRTPDRGDVELSGREFALLELLMRHPGAVRSREEILDRVWGFDFDPGSNVVEVYIRYLRQKIGPERIRTVRGAGYCLDGAA